MIEIQEMMREMKLPADEAHIRKCFARFDEDESGDIDYEEFLSLWGYSDSVLMSLLTTWR